MIITFSHDIKIKTSEYVYTPAEDTFFFEDCIKDYFSSTPGTFPVRISEMGCGSGYILISLMKFFQNSFFVAIDKNKFAVDLTEENILLNGLDRSKVEIIYSDLFSNVPKMSFDVILWNPPYLPVEDIYYQTVEDSVLKSSWEGGNQLIIDFLTSAHGFLNPEGVIILVLSNYQIKDDKIEEYINNIRPKYHLITYYKQKLLLETLFCVILKKDTE